tara:strand:+ start:439 stop:744 length:306 start_codon:yes stop_codon:yes gene_type:complete
MPFTEVTKFTKEDTTWDNTNQAFEELKSDIMVDESFVSAKAAADVHVLSEIVGMNEEGTELIITKTWDEEASYTAFLASVSSHIPQIETDLANYGWTETNE